MDINSLIARPILPFVPPVENKMQSFRAALQQMTPTLERTKYELPTLLPRVPVSTVQASTTPASTPNAAYSPKTGNALVDTAASWKGVDYKWGGTSRKGVDCSGLTLNVARQNGYKIPRTAAAQFAWFQKRGKTVDMANAQPGDYLYFRSSGPSGWHTGVYIGDGKMLDAPNTGSVVRVDAIKGRRLVGVGRLA